MTLPRYPDGCIVPNIRTRTYIVYFQPVCEHKKLRGAFVGIDAPNADDAMEYARHWVTLAGLIPVRAIEADTAESAAAILALAGE